MIRRFLTWLRRPKHVWQPTGYTRRPGCDGPYDYQRAITGKRRAEARERQQRELAARSSPAATVTPIRRAQ